ncbi:MAG TPA: hypothetical protein VFY87_02495, partial [Geminicoccaceae bacterium]|nr:hypothetical protein [Geminicoccaceae bacterium]
MNQAVAIRPAANPAVNPSRAGPALRLDVRKLGRAQLPPEAEHLRVELHDRGRRIGKIDLQRVPGTHWGELVERWVREERLPQLLPRHLRRYAWRDRRLLARLLRLAAERRTWRELWDLVHTPPRGWPERLRAYLVARQEVLLPTKRGTHVAG